MDNTDRIDEAIAAAYHRHSHKMRGGRLWLKKELSRLEEKAALEHAKVMRAEATIERAEARYRKYQAAIEVLRDHPSYDPKFHD